MLPSDDQNWVAPPLPQHLFYPQPMVMTPPPKKRNTLAIGIAVGAVGVVVVIVALALLSSVAAGPTEYEVTYIALCDADEMYVMYTDEYEIDRTGTYYRKASTDNYAQFLWVGTFSVESGEIETTGLGMFPMEDAACSVTILVDGVEEAHQIGIYDAFETEVLVTALEGY